MVKPREWFDLALVQHVAPWCLQWPLARLFPRAWAGSTRQFCLLWCLWIARRWQVR